MTHTTQLRSRAIAALAWIALLALPAGAPATGTGSGIFAGSPDITFDLSGTLLRPGDVADDIEVLFPGRIDLGPLPDGTQVSAYGVWGGWGAVFSVAHTATLPGGVTARPRDLVVWDGFSYSIAFDGRLNGIPDGVAIDAVAVDTVNDALWLSFDTGFSWFGTPLRDADVIDLVTFTRVFDATAADVPPGLDVDAVSMDPGSNDMLLSFDTSGALLFFVGGQLHGVFFADEDVLRYEPGSGNWTVALDASVSDPDWDAADLDAIHLLPEPGSAAMFAAATGLLALLARRRARARIQGGLR